MNFDQFLDTLSDEELQLMDSDPEFFNEMKTTFERKMNRTGLDKAVDISKKVTGATEALMTPITYPLGKIVEGSEVLSTKLAEAGHPVAGLVAATPSIAAEAVTKPFEWAGMAGEKIAEKGPAIGLSPEVSAGLGTTVAMIPDVAASALGAKPAASAITKGAKLAKRGAKAAFRPVETARAVLKAPGREVAQAAGEAERAAFAAKPKLAERVGQIAQKKMAKSREVISQKKGELARLPAEQVKKLAAREADLEKIGKVMEEIETPQGLSYTELGVPEKARNLKRFTNVMKEYAKKSPEQILAERSPIQIQKLRKLAQVTQDTSIPTGNKAIISRGQEKLGKALDLKLGDSYTVARAAWKAVKEEISTLPKEAIQKKAAIKNQLGKLVTEAKDEAEKLAAWKKKAKKVDDVKKVQLDAKIADSIYKASLRDAKIKKWKNVALATAGTIAGVGGVGSILGALKK